MCGIVGFVGLQAAADEYPARLERMLEVIRHRGPDEFGYYFDDHVGLGTARLSIIDLANGQQPMADPSGRYWIVFNGEIFNYLELRTELEAAGHRFERNSDTEVLLHALLEWGEGALGRLDGQFAFLFYDRLTKHVLAARDPYGERPLHYAPARGGVAFGSEIKSLFTLPDVRRALNETGIRHAFQFWTLHPGETCFDGVRSIPPGHFARVVDGAVTAVEPYYRLPTEARAPTSSIDESAERVRELLTQSVHRRLRSDVPVGTYLSGGVDSTIITYLAQEESRHQVQSFSVAFKDKGYDESKYQMMAAERLGTNHHPFMTSLSDIADGFPAAIWHAETVLFRTAPIPLMLLAQEVHTSGFKVVLTGEGADEAFLGYEIFKETLFREQYDQYANDDERIAALRKLYPYLAHFQDDRARSVLGFFARNTKSDLPGLFSHHIRFQNGLLGLRLLKGSYDDKQAGADFSQSLETLYPGFTSLPSVLRAQILEYTTLLGGYLLCSQGDRMSSAHSVEARCPFLEKDLVEFAFGLPQDTRLHEGREKHVLRQAFADVLPDELVGREKNPYRAPDAKALLRDPETEWLAALKAEHLDACGLIEGPHARQLLDRVQKKAPEAISPREDQACVLVLSLALLNERFVEHFPTITPALGERLVVRIDGRTLSAPA